LSHTTQIENSDTDGDEYGINEGDSSQVDYEDEHFQTDHNVSDSDAYCHSTQQGM